MNCLTQNTSKKTMVCSNEFNTDCISSPNALKHSESIANNIPWKKRHILSTRITSSPSNVQKVIKLILRLRHASRCQKHENILHDTISTAQNNRKRKSTDCSVTSHCQYWKKLWKHVTMCCFENNSMNIQMNKNFTGRGCEFPYCNRSRYALFHYKNCADPKACPVCRPIRVIIAKESEEIIPSVYTRDPAENQVSRKRQKLNTPISISSSDVQSPGLNLSKVNTNVDLENKQHSALLLRKLLDDPSAWVFSSPVDPVLLNIPDYFDIIKEPMDLGTVEQRLRHGEYVDVESFKSDIGRIFDNAIFYNLEGSEVYNMALDLKEKFIKECQKLVI